jgi:hypothetical protein
MDLAVTKDIAARLCSRMGWVGLRFIDSGNSGSVFAIDHPSHGAVALKVYDPAFFRGDNAFIEQKRLH